MTNAAYEYDRARAATAITMKAIVKMMMTRTMKNMMMQVTIRMIMIIISMTLRMIL